ncbi:MAG: AAA family ATPase [Pseudomonadota bacterium]
MASAFSLYMDFLKEEVGEFTENEKKIAGLISKNFHEIYARSKHGGHRANLISSKILAEIDKLSEAFELTSAEEEVKIIRDLTLLKVKSFRGFSAPAEFVFGKKFTFFCGDNGTGKSSLCEALELCLTGDIAEARNKRFDKLKYIRNLHTDKAELPILEGAYLDGDFSERIVADAKSNDSIFIEKNRIEGFSRVTSFTPAQQQERLSILFGVEDFSAFCTNFSGSISEKLPLVPIKGKILEDKKKALQLHYHTISNSQRDQAELEERKVNLLSKYPGISLVSDVVAHVDGDGTDERLGVLGPLEEKRRVLAGLKPKNLSVAKGLLEQVKASKDMIGYRAKIRGELAAFKDQISLRDLFASIRNATVYLKNDLCPACQTPIYDENGLLRLAREPFSYAEARLKELNEAIAKEAELSVVDGRIQTVIQQVVTSLTLLNVSLESPVRIDLVISDIEAYIHEADEIEEKLKSAEAVNRPGFRGGSNL